MAARHLAVTVAGLRQLTPRIREYRLESIDGKALPAYAPGAHIEVHTGDAAAGPIVRHYSLLGGDAAHDDPRHSYRVAVQREDRAAGSAYIHQHFDLGTRLRVSAPINNFPLDRCDTHSLLIAGGIGITPIFSMARSLARRRRDFTLAYAGRSAEAMAYRAELESLCGPRLRLHVSGARDEGQLDLVELLAAQPDGSTAYVCGPAPMVAATQDAARQLGWAPERVRSELFGVGARGDEVAFEVELRRSGRVFRVGKGTSILDALTAARADVLWDCRRGECGLCPQRVIEVDGVIDHRDRYLSDEERAAGDTLCICVSRIRGQRLVLDA